MVESVVGNKPFDSGDVHVRASGRSRKKSQISRDFQGQIRGKNGRFRGKFAGFSRPVSLKNVW